MNTQIINEITNQDYGAISSRIQNFLKNLLDSSQTKGFILGQSGGIDSAVTSYLCAKNFKEKTLALVMPDTNVSPESETSDGLDVIERLGIEYKLIDINPIVKEYSKYLEPDQKALGNIRARIRANLLYYYANTKNLLVVGTSDKSEHLIGYFTKFGDGSADICPIISLYKLQVRELGKFLGVPKQIIEKKSSPHLVKDHLAEEELGISYEQIDSVLYCLFEKKIPKEDVSKTAGIERSIVDRIYQMYETSSHKRAMPQTPDDAK